MKFKVGDRVRVTNATAHRAKEIGNIYTVEAVNKRGLECYPRKGVNYYSTQSAYIFYEDELELIPFAKADLKDGMVVEYRNGTRFLVLGDKLIGKQSWASIKHIKDDLCSNSEELIIDKVYKTSAYLIEEFFNDKYLTLIWERPKSAKKMTVEEIEKELGYKVEIVSDSEK